MIQNLNLPTNHAALSFTLKIPWLDQFTVKELKNEAHLLNNYDDVGSTTLVHFPKLSDIDAHKFQTFFSTTIAMLDAVSSRKSFSRQSLWSLLAQIG